MIDIPALHRTVREHLGIYNAHVSWYLQHNAKRPNLGHVADLIASRDRIAYEHLMADTEWPIGYAKDQSEWMPELERRLAPLVDAVREMADQ